MTCLKFGALKGTWKWVTSQLLFKSIKTVGPTCARDWFQRPHVDSIYEGDMSFESKKWPIIGQLALTIPSPDP